MSADISGTSGFVSCPLELKKQNQHEENGWFQLWVDVLSFPGDPSPMVIMVAFTIRNRDSIGSLGSPVSKIVTSIAMPLGPLPDIRETSLPAGVTQEDWEKSFKGALKGDRPAFPDCSAGPSPGLVKAAREKVEARKSQEVNESSERSGE
eukprot:s510_g12.t1